MRSLGREVFPPGHPWSHRQSLHLFWGPAVDHPAPASWKGQFPSLALLWPCGRTVDKLSRKPPLTDFHSWISCLFWFHPFRIFPEKLQGNLDFVMYLNDSYLFLADSRFSRISGRSPFLTELFTNKSPVGVLMKSSGERLKTHNHNSLA